MLRQSEKETRPDVPHHDRRLSSAFSDDGRAHARFPLVYVLAEHVSAGLFYHFVSRNPYSASDSFLRSEEPFLFPKVCVCCCNIVRIGTSAFPFVNVVLWFDAFDMAGNISQDRLLADCETHVASQMLIPNTSPGMIGKLNYSTKTCPSHLDQVPAKNLPELAAHSGLLPRHFDRRTCHILIACKYTRPQY